MPQSIEFSGSEQGLDGDEDRNSGSVVFAENQQRDKQPKLRMQAGLARLGALGSKSRKRP